MKYLMNSNLFWASKLLKKVADASEMDLYIARTNGSFGVSAYEHTE